MTVPIGATAPDFTLRDQHGQDVALSSFRGRASVALVFYPFAFSRVCTGELAVLRDRLPDLETDDVRLLALSCDPVFALRAYAEAEAITFPLLSDFWPHGAVASSYGVLDESRGAPRRSTYVVDDAGTVRWAVHNDAAVARDPDELVAALAGLRSGPDRSG